MSGRSLATNLVIMIFAFMMVSWQAGSCQWQAGSRQRWGPA